MGTVLVACDDVALQSILTAEIEGHHHRVVGANTGLDVLSTVAAELPDLVLISTSLPIYNGLETAQALREDPDVPANMPIVLVTAEPSRTTAMERAGVTETLCINHNAAEVADMLARHLPPAAMPDLTV